MKKLITILAIAGISSLMAADISAITVKCKACHGVDGKKMAPGATKLMTSLSKDQFVAALNGYKDGSYGGKAKALMKIQVKTLTPEQMTALADFYIK